MKKIFNKIYRHLLPVFAASLVGVSALTSCEDMMDLDSDDHVRAEDNKLNSANDSLYSAIGILTQLQKVGERYVLLGELRGDLMETTSDAPVWMQEISNFATTPSNIMSVKRDYYSIINNCNYALARMDTTITEHLTHVMVPEYTAIRTIRDWTYLQLGLAFGRVQWVDEPILSLEDSEGDYPTVELDQLVQKLVSDLEPIAANELPGYGWVDGFDASRFFLAPRLLLGDLYLLQNRYADAARMYYDFIRINEVCMLSGNGNTWESNQAMMEGNDNFKDTYAGEAFTLIPYSSDPRKEHPNLLNYTYSRTPVVKAASWWVNDLASATHFHAAGDGASSVTGFLTGDLRGSWFFADGTRGAVSVGNVTPGGVEDDVENIISKFYYAASTGVETTNPANPLLDGLMLRQVSLYRTSHVYLRYAEAVNRMGKPSLAFAVLKYGLNHTVVTDGTKVDLAELEDELPYTNFDNSVFDDNRGTASRGRGVGISLAQSTYVLPEFDTLQETIEWVENEIVREMAAETMFEGNRFFDLMRVSRHRGSNEFFAGKVSRRFANPDAAKSILLNSENWWLK